MSLAHDFHLKTKPKTKTECLKDPTIAMFLKSRGFKEIKNDTQMKMMMMICCEDDNLL